MKSAAKRAHSKYKRSQRNHKNLQARRAHQQAMSEEDLNWFQRNTSQILIALTIIVVSVIMAVLNN